MIRILPEGEMLRWGINLHVHRRKLLAVSIKFHRRLILKGLRRIGSASASHLIGPSLYLDLTLDHKAYRPNDVDGNVWTCRRCKESVPSGMDYVTASGKVIRPGSRSHCKGRSYHWRLS